MEVFKSKRSRTINANLAKGEVRIGEGKSSQAFDVKGGLVEVLKNKVVVLV